MFRNFRTLTINDKQFNAPELKTLCAYKLKILKPDNWEYKFYRFVSEWLNDSAYITAHTSGTTGVPKKIKIRKEAMLRSAQMTNRFLKLRKGDTALLALSCDYIAGKMMVARSFAGSLNLIPVEPSANPLKFVSTKQKIAFASFVPLQVKAILKNSSVGKFTGIRNVLIGGAPLTPELRKKFSHYRNNIFETYGMTETISHIALKRLSAPASGWFKTLDAITVKKDKRDCLVLNVPFISKKSIITNDIVALQSSKHFKWLGRADNVINSGGVKLLPETLEEKIKPLMKRRFFLKGKKDSLLGEKSVLVIEGSAFSPPALSALQKKLHRHLHKYELPKEIVFIPKFRETASGKIIRSFTK